MRKPYKTSRRVKGGNGSTLGYHTEGMAGYGNFAIGLIPSSSTIKLAVGEPFVSM